MVKWNRTGVCTAGGSKASPHVRHVCATWQQEGGPAAGLPSSGLDRSSFVAHRRMTRERGGEVWKQHVCHVYTCEVCEVCEVGAYRELRTKDLERIQNIIDDLNSKVKRGLTKEQKEDLATAEKVKEWLDSGKDVRYKPSLFWFLFSPPFFSLQCVLCACSDFHFFVPQGRTADVGAST